MGYLLNVPQEKIQELKVIAAREGVTIRKLLEDQVDQIIKEHASSNNPQSQITQFDREEVMPVPNLYEKNPEKWDKFYSLMSKKDYDEVDERVNFLLKKHNQASRKFNKF